MAAAYSVALFVVAGILVGGAVSMYQQGRRPVAVLLGLAGALLLAAGVLRL